MILTIARPGRYESNYRFSQKDYINVDYLNVRGTWKIGECMSFEDLAKLAIARNRAEAIEKARKRHG